MHQAIIADQWHLTCTGMSGLLTSLSLFRTVRVVSETASLPLALESLKPDICVVSLSSFPIHFQEIILTVQRHSPKTKIIVFSSRPETSLYVQSLKAGVQCCISLETTQQDLLRAVRYALRNEKFICPTVMKHLPNMFDDNIEPVHHRFSVKELQVFLLIGQGKSTQEIATELHISNQTVSTYKNRIFRKSNFKTNTSILKYIEEHRLVN